MLVKSPVAVSTSLPEGSEAATRPANTDTWLPTATDVASTLTSPAYASRAAAKSAS